MLFEGEVFSPSVLLSRGFLILVLPSPSVLVLSRCIRLNSGFVAVALHVKYASSPSGKKTRQVPCVQG